MNNKLCIGDEVQCVDNQGFADKLVLGSLYTVSQVHEEYISVYEINGPGMQRNGDWLASRFEFVRKPSTSMFIPVPISSIKETNPKDAVGTKKVPFSTVSGPVMAEIGVAMLEGARKYGRHNYRVSKVRASVYYDAAFRHLVSWFEGEDIDPDSGMSHVTKAIASLVVLRDAMILDKLVDDRPPRAPAEWLKALQHNVDDIFKRYPTAKEAHINDTK